MQSFTETYEDGAKDFDIKIVRRLLTFLKPYKKYIVFAMMLTLITSFITPLRPYLTKIAIDDYIVASDWNGLLYITILLFGLMIFSGLLRFGLAYLMEWVGQKVLYDLRMKVFNHIQDLSFTFYDKTPVGTLVTRVTNDIEALNKLFSSGIVMIIADFMLIFSIVGFMFYTNVELALISLSILPALIIVSFIFKRKVRKLFRDIRLQVSKMNSFLNETISGIFTVKLFNKEKGQASKFKEINAKTRELHLDTIFYYAVFFPIVEMISVLALCIVLWYTAGNIVTGVMTVGILIAFLQYAEMFFRPVRDLTEKYTTLQSALAAAERVFNILDEIKDIESTEKIRISEFNDKIEFRNVSFSYDGEKQVLDNISFEVKKGEKVAFVGATGSGKTTILNLLCGFYKNYSGEILIDGIELRELDQNSVRNLIALVMQDVFLFSRPIRENISLGNEQISQNQIENAAKAIGAFEFIDKLPEKFDEKVKERGATFSSGQKQLLSFTRAFASDPQILILDEATSNIDSKSESIIENSIETLLAGRTSIIIAHRLSTIKKANKIFVMHHGEIRESGNHNELLLFEGIYSKLYKLQFNLEVVG